MQAFIYFYLGFTREDSDFNNAYPKITIQTLG